MMMLYVEYESEGEFPTKIKYVTHWNFNMALQSWEVIKFEPELSWTMAMVVKFENYV
jgi:hypothetical protein